jgi:hypothetical protein
MKSARANGYVPLSGMKRSSPNSGCPDRPSTAGNIAGWTIGKTARAHHIPTGADAAGSLASDGLCPGNS